MGVLESKKIITKPLLSAGPENRVLTTMDWPLSLFLLPPSLGNLGNDTKNLQYVALVKILKNCFS